MAPRKRNLKPLFPAPQRTEKQIEQLLAQFQRLKEPGGLTNAAIAREMQVPLSSLYRWTRQLEKHNVEMRTANTPSLMDISEAIEILASDASLPENYISALCYLIAWMRWPSNPELHDTGALSLSMRYVKAQTDSVYVHQMSPQFRSIFERFMRVEDIVKIFSLEGPSIPYLNEFYINGKVYTDRDAVAEFTNYLLAMPDGASGFSSRPSLSKALYLLTSSSSSWPFSESTFKQLWRSYAPAAPFLFAEVFGSGLDWLIEPTADDFDARFDELTRDRFQVRDFLSKARWKSDELKRRLDPRAAARIRFPSFPADLEPVAVKPRGFTPMENHILRLYPAGVS